MDPVAIAITQPSREERDKLPVLVASPLACLMFDMSDPNLQDPSLDENQVMCPACLDTPGRRIDEDGSMGPREWMHSYKSRQSCLLCDGSAKLRILTPEEIQKQQDIAKAYRKSFKGRVAAFKRWLHMRPV